MSLYDIVQIGLTVFLTLAGVSLFCLGIYGSIHMRPLRMDRAFNLKQRIELTLLGLMLLAVAFTQLAGVVGEL
jgi:hypothetical protein